MIARSSTRIWLPCLAGCLAASVLAAGCSSTPSYCAAGQQLKTSVQDLGKINVAQSGLGAVKSALQTVGTNARKFADEANGAFAPQVSAFRTALTGLQAAFASLRGSPSPAALQNLSTQGQKVRSSYNNLQNAWQSHCG